MTSQDQERPEIPQMTGRAGRVGEPPARQSGLVVNPVADRNSRQAPSGVRSPEQALGAEDEDQDQDREDDRLRPVAAGRSPAEARC